MIVPWKQGVSRFRAQINEGRTLAWRSPVDQAFCGVTVGRTQKVEDKRNAALGRVGGRGCIHGRYDSERPEPKGVVRTRRAEDMSIGARPPATPRRHLGDGVDMFEGIAECKEAVDAAMTRRSKCKDMAGGSREPACVAEV